MLEVSRLVDALESAPVETAVVYGSHRAEARAPVYMGADGAVVESGKRVRSPERRPQKLGAQPI